MNGEKLLTSNLCSLNASREYADGKAPRSQSELSVSVRGYDKLAPLLEVEVNRGTWKALHDWDDHLEDTRLDWLTNPDVAT